MKKITLFALLLLLLSSCSVRRGFVQSIPFNNEKTIQSEFNSYLKSKDKLSVVLRVPSSASGVTQEEVSKNNALYLQIEKELMKEGRFEVRDRALLNLLLESGITDYNEIARKTHADVIIEIISVSYPQVTNRQVKLDLDKPKAATQQYMAQHIRVEVADIEFKLVQIDTGMTGAISTFYLGNGSYFYYRGYKLGWNQNNVIHSSLRLVQRPDYVVNEFSKYLISMLKGLE
jgi:hypothetical protein